MNDAEVGLAKTPLPEQRPTLFSVVGYFTAIPFYDAYARDRICSALSGRAKVLVVDPFALNYPTRYVGLGDAGFSEERSDDCNQSRSKACLRHILVARRTSSSRAIGYGTKSFSAHQASQ